MGRLTKLLVLLVAILTVGQTQSAFAQNITDDDAIAAIDACLSEAPGATNQHDCLGRAVDLCLVLFPNEAVVPPQCWEKELFVWDRLLNDSYRALMADIRSRDYADFEEPIRVAQRNWLDQKRLDCQLEIASNPRTYDYVLMPACHARLTMERFFFVGSLIGADWTPLPE